MIEGDPPKGMPPAPSAGVTTPQVQIPTPPLAQPAIRPRSPEEQREIMKHVSPIENPGIRSQYVQRMLDPAVRFDPKWTERNISKSSLGTFAGKYGSPERYAEQYGPLPVTQVTPQMQKGTDIHNYAQKIFQQQAINPAEISPDMMPHVRNLQEFSRHFQPLAVEQRIRDVPGFSGVFDLVGHFDTRKFPEFDGKNYLIELKSTNLRPNEPGFEKRRTEKIEEFKDELALYRFLFKNSPATQKTQLDGLGIYLTQTGEFVPLGLEEVDKSWETVQKNIGVLKEFLAESRSGKYLGAFYNKPKG